MDGYAGKFLNINLNSGIGKEFLIPEEIIQKYLGGKGLGVWLLYQGLEPHIDPLGPENVLLLITGPLTGVGIPAFNHLSICTKSPLTGTFVDAALGGDFAIKLKSCGYDGIILRGKSPKPVIIDITVGKWKIRNAGALWGTNVVQAQELLSSKVASTICIGPAGENLVRYATIVSGEHTAQRGGVGAVMGSKLVKAIRVGGDFETPVFDRDRLKKPLESIKRKLKLSAETLGTQAIRTLAICNTRGVLPTRNFTSGTFDRYAKVTAETLRAQVKRKAFDCPGCPILCTTEIKIPTKSGALKIKGPGYQSLAMLGSNLLIDDLDSVIRNNYLCYLLGMDPISTGETIAVAMELSEKGRMDLPLRFGSPKEVGPLLPLIAERKGPGDELANGAMSIVMKYGYTDLAMAVKGMEVPGYDPRGAWGQGLAYATSPAGATHTGSMLAAPEIIGFPAYIHGARAGGKVKLTIFAQNLFNSLACLVFCNRAGYALLSVPGWIKKMPVWSRDLFVSIAPSLSVLFVDLFDIYRALSYVTGIHYDRRTFLKVGERIFTLERMFNLREGFTSKDDSLPLRFIGEPLSEGPASGKVVPLTKMLLKYYKLRGWSEVGIPTSQCLERLRIEFAPLS